MMQRRRSRFAACFACATIIVVAACSSSYTTNDSAADGGGAILSDSSSSADVFVADSSPLPPDAADPLDASVSDGPLADAGACGPGCHVMFVTSTTFTGNLGGQAGADLKCQAAATNSTSAAIRMSSSRMVAWISTGNTNDPGMTARLPAGAATFARVDGKLIAGSVSELLSGTIRINIVEDESGSAIQTGNLNGASWTGTQTNGKTSGNTCADWTAMNAGNSGDIGQASEVNANWTDAGPVQCNQTKHLYCLEL
jgi:hypothetical protein